MNVSHDNRQHIPSVDTILNRLNQDSQFDLIPHSQKVNVIRSVLNRIRDELNGKPPPSQDEILHEVQTMLCNATRKGIRRVINGSGIILHTNLGRAVLPKEAYDAIAQLTHYCNLQIDLHSGERGRRETEIESLLQELTGAEAATIVNNNAAATLLVLSALCHGKEVIVSRGQLIEIGGSFRLPDIITQSGAKMVEVGTTNKTHLRDYQNAITEETAMLLRVNPSNYRIVGFSKSVPIEDMVQLKASHDLVVVDDLGCGALVDLSQYGLPKEPTVQDSIAAGADVALFSGDKLISGPQAGVIVGRKEYINIIRKHPLMRALRVDKFTIAAMEATLNLFLNPKTLIQTHPTLRMIHENVADLTIRAERLYNLLLNDISCEIIEGKSACGGGSLPDTSLPTVLIALEHDSFNATEMAQRLRFHEPPVISRIINNRVCLDLRTLFPNDETDIVHAIQTITNQEKGEMR